jgi:hypothetical protein
MDFKEMNPFARGVALGSRLEALSRIPPAPFDLRVSALPAGRAEAITEAVMTTGHHACMTAMIVGGEMWVSPRDVHELCAPGHDITDPADTCCYIPASLYVDRAAIDQERANLRAAQAT